MKGAILIYGGNVRLRAQTAETFIKGCGKEDLLTINILEGKKSLGIEQVREAVSFIQKKPFTGNMKAIVIPNAEKLTTEAQNALLKTLEEPPIYASIILLTKTQEALLPTVLSRCQKAAVEESKESEERVGDSSKKIGDGREKSEIRKIIQMDVEEKFAWAQEEAKQEKEDVIDMLEIWIREERENLGENSDKVQNMRLILETKQDLEKTNLNCRLALETLALNLL
jgi:DNA polymerase III subunit delta'